MSDPALTLQTAATDILLLSIETALGLASNGITASDIDTALFGDAMQAADGTPVAGAGLGRKAQRGPGADPGAGSQDPSQLSGPFGAGTATGNETALRAPRVPLQATSFLDPGGSTLATLAGVSWMADGSSTATPILGNRERPAVAPTMPSHLADSASTGIGMSAPGTAAVVPNAPGKSAATAAQTAGTSVPAAATLPTLLPATGPSATAGTGTGVLSQSPKRAGIERGSGRSVSPPPSGFNPATVAPIIAAVSVIRSDANTAQPSGGVPDPARPVATTPASASISASATAAAPAALAPTLRPAVGLVPRSIPAERPGLEAAAGRNQRTPVSEAGADPFLDLSPRAATPKFFSAEPERFRTLVIDKQPDPSSSTVHVPGTAPSAAPSPEMPDPDKSATGSGHRTAEDAVPNGVSPEHAAKAPFRSPAASAEHGADGARSGLPPAPPLPAEVALTAPPHSRPLAMNPALPDTTAARQDDPVEPRKQDEPSPTRSVPSAGTGRGGLEPQLPIEARTLGGQSPNKETAFGKPDQDRKESGLARRITTDATSTTSIERDSKTASKSDGAPHPTAAAPDHDRRASAEAGTSGGDGRREHGKAGAESVRPGIRIRKERADNQDATDEAAQVDAAASPSMHRAMPELFGQEAPLGLPAWTGSLDDASGETADKGGRIRSGLDASEGRLEEPQAGEEDPANGDDGLPQQLRDEAAFVHVPRERDHLLPEFPAQGGLVVQPVTDLQVVEPVTPADDIAVPDRERIIVRFAAATSMRPSDLAWGVWDVTAGQSPSPYEAQGPPSWSARKGGTGTTRDAAAGTVNLLNYGYDGAIGTACSWLRCGGDAGDLGPNLKGLAPGGSMLDGWNLVVAEVEEVADPIVGGQEALCLAG